MFRFQHVARTGDDVEILAIRNDQHRFELLQVLVGAPILGQLHAGALQLTRSCLQFRLKPLQQGKGICGGASKTCHHIIAPRRNAAHLAGGALDHGLSKADLSVARDHNLATLADADDCGAVPAGKVVVSHGVSFSPLSRYGPILEAAQAPQRKTPGAEGRAFTLTP